ncbi:hydroxyethylthiazole kinase [Commensalibacter oyaizuii]|uniref:Hydroxyethylthiazole kinase n=1 Tax=Commensalibacter oyaizuii TaxID=3043873 RepID=A0ABT6Q2L4_9PROT|nr:hydroxyethylthiazole kinase [Commensalibacter sp. TBRC 16381]MDI2091369.1 hydroxyethylthiazole kinase [Commensalibacter sp. TBRC 16381]
MFTAHDIASTLDKIRNQNPLIHNITNIVVSGFTANVLLALGASPAMVNAAEEVQEFVQKVDALVINLGTLTTSQAQAMQRAVDTAHHRHIPWVMDPVGIGASTYRSNIAVDLLHRHPRAIRGNASEIMTLSNVCSNHETSTYGRGVDSHNQPEQALEVAKNLAISSHTVVSISGRSDYITDGKRTVRVDNGHKMMTKVTGSGCSATAITAACLAVEPDALVACAHAMAIIGVVGELSMQNAKGPGSLQMHMLDEFYWLNEEKLLKTVKIQAI